MHSVKTTKVTVPATLCHMNPSPMRLPKLIEAEIEGLEREQITLGETLANVFRLSKNGLAQLYLKITPTDHWERPTLERDKLLWLGQHLPVPEVIAFEEHEGMSHLLMTALPGQDLVSMGNNINQGTAMTIIGEGLRMIHEVSIKDCPFNRTLGPTIAMIRQRVVSNLIDESDFDDRFQGLTADEVYAYMIATEPETEDAAFTHGDYCVPNIIADGDQLSGFIDLGRAGVADPYTDIGIGIRSIIHNYGDAAVPEFLAAYGIQDLDEQKVSYYQTVDEFF